MNQILIYEYCLHCGYVTLESYRYSNLICENAVDKMLKVTSDFFDSIFNIIESPRTKQKIIDYQRQEDQRLKEYLKKYNINADDIKKQVVSKNGFINIVTLKKIIEEIKHELATTTPSKIIAAITGSLIILVLNTAIFTFIFIFLVKSGGSIMLSKAAAALFSAILMAPFLEEAYKRAGVKHKATILSFLSLPVAEFGLYVMHFLQSSSISVVIIFIVRTIALFVHAFFTYLHKKGALEHRIVKLSDIKTDRNIVKESQQAATLLHMFYNINPLLGGILMGGTRLAFQHFPNKQKREILPSLQPALA